MSGEVEGSGGVGYLVPESSTLCSGLGMLSLQLLQSHLQLCVLRHGGGGGGQIPHSKYLLQSEKNYFYNHKMLSPCRKILTKMKIFKLTINTGENEGRRYQYLVLSVFKISEELSVADQTSSLPQPLVVQPQGIPRLFQPRQHLSPLTPATRGKLNQRER